MNGCFGVPTDILSALANELEACANFHKKDTRVGNVYHYAYPSEVTDSLEFVANQLSAIAPLFETLDAIMRRALSNETYDDLLDQLTAQQQRARQSIAA